MANRNPSASLANGRQNTPNIVAIWKSQQENRKSSMRPRHKPEQARKHSTRPRHKRKRDANAIDTREDPRARAPPNPVIQSPAKVAGAFVSESGALPLPKDRAKTSRTFFLLPPQEPSSPQQAPTRYLRPPPPLPTLKIKEPFLEMSDAKI